MSFLKHKVTCLGSGDFHSYASCPFRAHVCAKCGKVVRTSKCEKCESVKKRKKRDNKFHGMEAQMFKALDSVRDWKVPLQHTHSMSRDTKKEVSSMVKEALGDLRNVSLNHAITAETKKNVNDIVENALSSMKDILPDIGMEVYERIKKKVKKDLGGSIGTSKPELFAHVVSSVGLLLRSIAKSDWMSLGLTITQFMSSYGVFGAGVRWIISKFKSFEQVFRGMFASEDEITVGGEMDSSPIISLVLSLLHLLVFKSKPNWAALSTFVMSMSKVNAVSTGLSGLIESFSEASRLITNWIKVQILGCDPATIAEEVDPYCAWCDRVDALWKCQSRKEAEWTLDHLKEFDALYEEGTNLRRNTHWLNKDRALNTQFTTRMNLLFKLQDEINQGNIRQSTRVEPFLLNFFGESAVGKSLLVPSVISEFMAEFHTEEFVRQKYDHNACCFTRKSGDDRWDGVGNQRVIYYDDWMQVKDSTTNPSKELFEVIELSNSSPFTPLMAALDKKGKVRLEPELIILSCNEMKPDIVSLSKPVAVYRRFDMLWKVLPHEDIVHKGLMSKDLLVERHESRSCGCNHYDSSICMNANKFQRYKVEQRINDVGGDDIQVGCEFVPIGEPVQREEMMEIFRNELRAHKTQRKSRLQFFKDYGKKKVYEKLEKALGGNDQSTVNLGGEMDSDVKVVTEAADDWDGEGFRGSMLAETIDRLREESNDLHHDFQEPSDLWDTDSEDEADQDFTPFEEDTDLKKLAGSMYTGTPITVRCVDTPGCQLSRCTRCNPKEHWVKTRLKKIMSRVKQFILDHPILSIFGTAMIVWQLSSSMLSLVKKKTTYEAENDDSCTKIDVRHKNCRSYRREENFIIIDDEDESEEKTLKENKCECENDDSCTKVDMKRCQKRTFRTEHNNDPSICDKCDSSDVKVDSSPVKQEVREKTYTKENDDSCTKLDHRRAKQRTYRKEGLASSLAPSKGLFKNKKKDIHARQQEWWAGVQNLVPDDSDVINVTTQGVSDPNLIGIMKKVFKQTYLLETHLGHKLGSCVVVKGRLILTFGHVASFVKCNRCFIRNVQTGVAYELDSFNYDVCGDSQDAIIFEGPRQMPAGSDIIHHFMSDFTASDRVNYTVRLLVPNLGNSPDTVTQIHCGSAKALDRVVSYDDGDGAEVIMRQYYMYKFDTQKGFCGSLLYKEDSKNSAKIIGMHVCGVEKKSVGLASAICCEAIRECVSQFSVENQCSFPIDDYKADMSVPGPHLEKLGYMGRAVHSITDQRVTKISPSAFYGWDGEPIKKPALLCGTYEGVNIKDIARQKLYKGGFTAKNKTMLEVVRKAVGHSIESSSTLQPFLWTIEEAAFGVPGRPFCDAVDMNTSSGMPWKLSAKGQGKKSYLNKGKNFIKKDLRDAVQNRIDAAKDNRRLPVVWSDHYKDELRLNEKVHKPRLFSGGPLDYTLTIRMYFGQWCAAVMDGRIENEIGVGINPHGPEWTLLAKTMQANSTHIACADFEKYDGSLDPDIMWAALDMINDWYDDEHKDVRRVLFEDIVNAVHQAGGQYYQMDHGNPSGNALTALLNSVYQLIAIKYTMMNMGYSLGDILKKVRMITYGDDNMMSVVGGESFLSMQSLRDALWSELGLSMTNASKTGVPAYGPIEDADFLSRKFRLEDTVYYAPRPWENLSLGFDYVKSDEPWEEVAKSYSESCFYELSHYKESDFKLYTKAVKDLYNRHGMVCAPIMPIEYYRRNFLDWADTGRNLMLCWGL
ncbi:hypothetical protein 1 [Wenling picorna-like virus 5]|uniref:hypothetical protein 1 n=1 Tax=Wenling picorna-like virus 5 TaxID=1923533 RepID=UPI00090BEBF8|nr:hypothetical protein 1 [Wenling picorna-like virus 5]APG78485.1 hypothetical protein 1 [Wenling picorna-like virus 5]